MRYLHPVAAHERFVAGGRYDFYKLGAPLQKSETWTMHVHPDGEQFLRVDADALREEGRSVLAEALYDQAGALARLDIRYENARFPGGVRQLRATYQLTDACLQVGYELNGAERQYHELPLPPDTLMDVPLLAFRGRTIAALAGRGAAPTWLFVPAFDYAQLLPGTLQQVLSPVSPAGTDILRLGNRAVATRRFTYHDKAAAYWLDKHDVIIRRVNAFQQQEIVVQVSNYVAPASNLDSATC